MNTPGQSSLARTCAADIAIGFAQLPQSSGSDTDDTAVPVCERVLNDLTPSDSSKHGAELPLRNSTSLSTANNGEEQHPLRERRGLTESCLRIYTAQPQIGSPQDSTLKATETSTNMVTPCPVLPHSTQQPGKQTNEYPSPAVSVTDSSWSMLLSQTPLSLSALPPAPESARSITSADGEAARKLRSALRDDTRHLFEAKGTKAESLNSFVHTSCAALMMLSGQAGKTAGGVKMDGLNDKEQAGLKHVSLPSPCRPGPLTPRAASMFL